MLVCWLLDKLFLKNPPAMAGFFDWRMFTISIATAAAAGGRFRASKGHRPARAKPPGESQRGLSPGPPPVSVELVKRLQCGAALVAEDCLNFRVRRKQSSAKSPHGLLCGLSGSRTGLGGTVVCRTRDSYRQKTASPNLRRACRINPSDVKTAACS